MVGDLEAVRAEFLSSAETLRELLRSYGRQHWAEWAARDRERIQRGDASGIDHLLGAYGGMGSLNDVMIHPANGDHIAPEDVIAVNAGLRELSSRVYDAAQRLKHARNLSRLVRKRGSLVGGEQFGYESEQVTGDLSFKAAGVAHGVDEAHGAVPGQDVVVPASVAGDGELARRSPFRAQVPDRGHVQGRPVWSRAEDAAGADRGAAAH